MLLRNVIQQAAGRGHQNVQWFAQTRRLRVDVHAAKHHHGGQMQIFAIGFD